MNQNYPRMLYKREDGQKYTDSDAVRDDLRSGLLKTYICADEDQEATRREAGWVDLSDLMIKPEPKKTISLNKGAENGRHNAQ